MAEHEPYPGEKSDEGKVATVAPARGGGVGVDEEPDPLASLHKMSTTAGVGTQEYVAVNVTAVVAVLLAVLGALSMVVDILLVIPLAAVICAVVALRQIKDSNGTQTGRGLAWAAVVLSVLFAGGVGSRKLMEHAQLREDNRQIQGLIVALGNDVKAGKWQEAYDLFSPRFQARVNLKAFSDRWDALQKNPYFGKVKEMKGNGLLDQGVDNQTNAPIAGTMVLIQSEDANVGETRQEGYFIKQGGAWKIENIPSIFPVERPARPTM